MNELNAQGNAHAGPSKGKGIDPTNFGNIEFLAEEIDVEEQRKALELWKAVKAIEENTLSSENRQRTYPVQRESNSVTSMLGKKVDVNKSTVKADRNTTADYLQDQIRQYNRHSAKEHRDQESSRKLKPFMPLASFPARVDRSYDEDSKKNKVFKPTDQVNPRNYICRALRIRDKESSDSQSSSDSTDNYSMETPPSTHLSDDEQLVCLSKHLNKKHERYLQKTKMLKSLIKPQPPDVYDGAPD